MRFIVALLFLVYPNQAFADPLEDYADWFAEYNERRDTELEAAREVCTSESASVISFQELIATSMYRWSECLTVEGLLLANDEGVLTFFMDWASVYYHDRATAGRGGVSPFRIGIDDFKGQLPDFENASYQAEVTGVVRDCGSEGEYLGRYYSTIDMPSDRAPHVWTLSGYCHGNGRPSLWVTDIEFRQRQVFPRVSLSNVTPNLRSLWPMHDDWNATSVFVETAGSFFDSVRSGRFTSNLEGIVEPMEISRWFDARPAQMQALQSLPNNPQSAFFVFREADRSHQPVLFEDEDSFTAVACYCRVGDCSGEWPVSLFDASWDARRPYVSLTGDIGEEHDLSIVRNIGLPWPHDAQSPFFEPGGPSH